MYPIPALEILDLDEIADHWSATIQPQRKQEELLLLLERSWWRGEFVSRNKISRLGLLRALFLQKRETLPFWIDGESEPETSWVLPDGSEEFLCISAIPVPSGDPDTWTDAACNGAFSVIAKHWGATYLEIPEFGLIWPLVRGVCLTERDFSIWLQSKDYRPQVFWGRVAPQESASLVPVPPNGPPQKRGKKPLNFNEARRRMIEDLTSGKFTAQQLSEMTEEALRAQYGYSRDTVRKARVSALSEIVGNSGS